MRRALLALAALLLAVAAGVAVCQRRDIAERLLLDQIRRAGIQEASLAVEAVGAGGLSLTDLRLGEPPALEAARVDVRYSPASLRSGSLEELRVTGLRLRACYDEDGLSLGALDGLRQGGGGGALPARRIAVEDGRVDLEAPFGAASLPFEIEVEARGDGRFEAAADFELHHPSAEASGRAGASGAPDDFEATLRGRLDLPDLELSAEKIAVSARVTGENADGDLRIGELRDERRPARLEPLRLRGGFEIRGSSADYRLTLANPEETLALDANGSADLANRTARADLHLRPVAFEPRALQPGAIFPFLEGEVEQARGTVEATGAASWDGARAAAEIHLALREIGFTARGVEIARLNGRVEFAGPFPPVTEPGQLISIARIDAGLTLTDGLVEFQLRPDATLDVQQAEWQWAGGVVRTAAVLDPMADDQQLVLEVAGVDLAELLALVDLEGLEGRGTLEGEIPVFRSGESVEIRGGELRATPAGGWIRYQPPEPVEALADRKSGLDLLFGALENFQYDSLRLTLSGDARGELDVAVHLGGFNPNFEGGRRVEFNLNVEARLADLLRAGLAAYRVPEAIQKRLEEFQAPEVP